LEDPLLRAVRVIPNTLDAVIASLPKVS